MTTLTASAAALKAMQKRPHRTLHDRLNDVAQDSRKRETPQEPTKERQARSPNGFDIGSQTRTYRERTPIDLYWKELSAAEQSALLAYQEMADRANAACAAPIAGYGGIRGGGFGPGRGRVHDGHARDAFTQFMDLRDDIEPEFLKVLDLMVVENRISAADYGASMMSYRGEERHIGGGIVGLKLSLVRAASVIKRVQERRRHNGGPR